MMREEFSQALKQGDLAKVNQLVADGADIHYCDEDGYNAALDCCFGKQSNVLDALRLVIDYGVNLSAITSYAESPLRIMSRRGRFDVVKLLLEAGADESQLAWTPLIKATAMGTLQDMQQILQQHPDLEQTDYWQRSAWLVSILCGDISKATLLQQHGANTKAKGRCGQPPLFYAIKGNAPHMLQWLIEQGQDVHQECDSESTCLQEAVDYNNLACAQILIAAGVDVDKNGCGGPALSQTENVAMIELLLSANADPKNLRVEGQRALLGYADVDQRELLTITQTEFEQNCRRKFGCLNPERMNNPFWDAMVRHGQCAYAPRKHFAQAGLEVDEAVWCADRFGQSLTRLADGRIIQIAGEHEDWYDPDFCIYNDVIVHYPDGKMDIYGYPAALFPPTDFHTATLVGQYIYIIGSLGYPERRQYGVTPVYRLNIDNYAIEMMTTAGDIPGWISGHRAELLNPQQIRVRGGDIYQSSTEPPIDNTAEYILDLTSLCWKKQACDTQNVLPQ